ncbi:hypothetical protein FACS189442_3550 [Spirochaetia bacterium]|nr:hypothetical protein FACS189442_3550 [Spirochaetia bacterium]
MKAFKVIFFLFSLISVTIGAFGFGQPEPKPKIKVSRIPAAGDVPLHYSFTGFDFENYKPARWGLEELLKLEADHIKAAANTVRVQYSAYIANDGNTGSVYGGGTAGNTGQNKRMEAVKIKLVDAPAGASILYSAYVQKKDWMPYVQNDAIGGTTGQGLFMEAIKIKLNEKLSGFSVTYRVYQTGTGWSAWVSDDKPAGTTGSNRPIEAIEIKIKSPSFSFVGHSQGGERSLATAGYLKTHEPDTYDRLDSIITVSGIDRGLKVLEGGLGAVKSKAQTDVNIAWGGLRAGLAVFLAAPLANMFPGAPNINNGVDFVLHFIPRNIPYYYIVLALKHPDTDKLQELHDMVPGSPFIRKNVVDIRERTRDRKELVGRELYTEIRYTRILGINWAHQ